MALKKVSIIGSFASHLDSHQRAKKAVMDFQKPSAKGFYNHIFSVAVMPDDYTSRFSLMLLYRREKTKKKNKKSKKGGSK